MTKIVDITVPVLSIDGKSLNPYRQADGWDRGCGIPKLGDFLIKGHSGYEILGSLPPWLGRVAKLGRDERAFRPCFVQTTQDANECQEKQASIVQATCHLFVLCRLAN